MHGPGRDINGKAFDVLGKLLKDMHASAHSILPDYVSPNAKHIKAYIQRLKEGDSWLDLSSSYSRLYLDCHMESLKPYS